MEPSATSCATDCGKWPGTATGSGTSSSTPRRRRPVTSTGRCRRSRSPSTVDLVPARARWAAERAGHGGVPRLRRGRRPAAVHRGDVRSAGRSGRSAPGRCSDGLAERLAATHAWGLLYDLDRLAADEVPVFAADDFYDMYVDSGLGDETGLGAPGRYGPGSTTNWSTMGSVPMALASRVRPTHMWAWMDLSPTWRACTLSEPRLVELACPSSCDDHAE